MKAAGGPQKLRFTILSFSGEDSDYPARELLYHSPQTRGWQTPRFCKYPQEVVLRLEQPSRIQQLQLLSHEYKIATKVEVFVSESSPADDVSKAPFKRLGYLSFDSNERSNHQARELKSVHVNVQALVIRLVIHRCHVNKLNIYNQVGLIALNLIGEPLSPGPDLPPGGYLQLHPPITRDVPYYNQAAADVADLNLDIHVDTVTAAKIRELAKAKDAAVAAEDYDEAKRLKASIDRLKVVGQKIAQLEARKRAAVEKEDYDTAKLIKADIDKLRSAGEAAAISSEQFAPRGGRGSTGGTYGRLPSKGSQPLSFDDIPVRGMRASSDHVMGQGDGNGLPVTGQNHSYQHQGADDVVIGAYDEDGIGTMADIHQEASYNSIGNERTSAFGNKHTAYDERPAQGRGRYTPSEEAMADASITRNAVPGMAAGPAQSDIPAPEGWPADLPAPEPLSGATAKDAEPLEELCGEYVARAAYSKQWQLREAVIQHLVNGVKDGSLVSKPGALRTISNLIRRGTKDKVTNVYLSSVAAVQQLVDGFSTTASAKDVQALCEACLPALLEKLGDVNTRLRDASKDCVIFIAGLRDLGGLRAVTSALVKPIKNQNAWRLVLGVLNLLQELVPVVGMSKSGGDGGFELQELMEFVGKAYGNSNADVRAAAVKVTREVADLVGPVIRKHLPKDINPKIKEQLDAVLGNDMPPPPPPQPTQPTTTAARATRGASQQQPASSSKTPVKGKAGGGPANTNLKSGGGQAPTAGRSAPSQQPPRPAAQPPQPPAQQPAMPLTADDPRPFEEELRARETALGPTHPDVAESCSNLATLYNQKGDTARAMPLYERALAIYEAHYGPDHPEVAHTLTDLAVLHLEQGNDAVGRPLLEHALVIQEKALGPDHPDVIAIKDVLNSE